MKNLSRLNLFLATLFTVFSLGSQAQSWSVQNTFTGNFNEAVGMEYDGTYLWVYDKNLNLYYKYTNTGSLAGIKQITALSKSGDFAYDGSYFYTISSQTSTLFKYDLNSSASTPNNTYVTSLPTGMTFVAYDATALSGAGGLWIGGGSNNIYLLSMTGVVSDSILASTHGLTDVQGGAVDLVTPGGPYLWTMTAATSAGSHVTIKRNNLSTGLPSSITKSMTGLVTTAGDMGGGLCITTGLQGTSTTLAGCNQDDLVFYFDLSTCSSERFDLEIKNLGNLDYPQPNSSIAFKYTLANNGSDSVHSATVLLQADNHTPDTVELTQLNLGLFDTLRLSDTLFINAFPGFNHLSAEIIAVNGSIDSVTANNSISQNFRLYDLDIVFDYSPNYVPTTSPVELVMVTLNKGIAPVYYYDVNYQVDGGNMQTARFYHPHLKTGELDTFEITLNLPLGSHYIDLTALNPNDSIDQGLNNSTASHTVEVYDSSLTVPRTPLIEVFTSSTCGPCVQASNHFKNVLPQTDSNWVCVKYQMSWPGAGDPYYTAEGGVRRNYYTVTGVPFMALEGFSAYPGSLSVESLLEAASAPTYLSLDANYTLDWRTMDLDVSLTPNLEYTSNNLRVFAAILEKETHNNVGTNGETDFYYVMKKMISGASGSSVNLSTANSTVQQSFNYKFPGSYRLPNNASDAINVNTEHSVEEFEDLMVAVWVQDVSTDEVLQATWATGTYNIGLDENESANNVSVYPNPASESVVIAVSNATMQSVEVINTTGTITKRILLEDVDRTMLQVSQWKAGLYILRIQTSNGVVCQKVIVQR